MSTHPVTQAVPIPQPIAPENRDTRPSTTVQVLNGDDPTVIHLVIDRYATLKELTADFKRVIRPYVSSRGEPDPRILEALELKLRENASFNEASRRVFGSTKKASSIRYWFNKQKRIVQ